MNKHQCIAVGMVLILAVSGYAAEPKDMDQLIQKAAKALDNRFFGRIIPDDKLQEAYRLAQEEDFSSESCNVVTDEMFLLTDQADPALYDADLVSLHDAIRDMPDQTAKRKALSKWRGIFLDRLCEYMRHKNSLKPVWRLSLDSRAQYDSNVNLLPPDETGPARHGGKDDFQECLRLGMIWKPLVNNKAFSRAWTLSMPFNATRTLQSEVKENEVFIMDAETNFTRRMSVMGLRDVSLRYRLQHFMMSGRPARNEMLSRFASHRFRVDMRFRPATYSVGAVRSTHTELSMSMTDKNNFDNGSEGKNAFVVDAELSQNFAYLVGRALNSLIPAVEYASYITDGSAENNYRRWELGLSHSHKNRLLRRDIRFSESAAYSEKSWTHFQNQEEDSTRLQVGAGTRFRGNLHTSLDMAFLWKENSGDARAKTHVRQHQITWGLGWSIP